MAWIRRFTAINTLIAGCTIGLLVPTIIFSWLQYRSLQQLRAKTPLAERDQVAQGLDLLRRRLEERMGAVSRDSLGQLQITDLAAEHLDATGKKFQSILHAHPGLDYLFAVSECSCRGEPFAILSTRAGAERIGCSRFTEPVVADVLGAMRAARPVPGLSGSSEVLYFQSGARPAVFAFRLLPGSADPKDGASYVGLAMRSESLLRAVVPEVLAQLRGHDSSPAADLVFSVTENRRGAIYSSQRGAGAQEVTLHGGPMFPLWSLNGRHDGATIDSLAQAQFRNGLILSGTVLGCLMLAITLALRAVAKESRLAALKSAFVSNVSHEMKTPLSLIGLFAETLELGRVTDSAKRQEYYRVIHSESRRLSQLIERVLDFARIEAGRKRYELVKTDLAGLVEDVVRTYAHQIAASGFQLTMDIQRPLSPARIDAAAVSQAVLNLIDNALKYSAGRKEIRVWVQERGGEVAIEVADKGIGIPASEQERIFEKFYRVGAPLVHETRGSGLGLTLTKHIVEAHGGRIQVESRVGHGSRFTIFLPVSPIGDAGETERVFHEEPIAQSADR